MSNILVGKVDHSCQDHITLLYRIQLFTAAKLTEEKNENGKGGSSQKSPVSLKEDLLEVEILDCCLSHEERVSDVERKCENNHQNIR